MRAVKLTRSEKLTDEDKLDLLAETVLFRGVASVALKSVASEGEIISLKKGEFLFREGDSADELYVIARGGLRIVKSSSDGEVVELHRTVRPGVVGELALVDGGTRSASAVATTSTDVFVLSRDSFFRGLDTEPEVRRAVFRMLCEIIRRTSDQMADMVFLDIKARVASRLVELSIDSGDLTRTRRVTQREIAEMVGGTRQSVNQALRLFEEAGYVRLDVEGIHVVDAAGLRAFAAG